MGCMTEATFCPGWKIGHYTDTHAATGCTVLFPPPGNVASCDIRGSSPGSRELTLLDVERKLTEIHALLLTGGSAFGLAAADGVVSWLEERGVGYQTRAGVVPIVPAAVVFDLGQGRPDVRPGRAEGRAACDAAGDGAIATGVVGAGTGCSVGKWAGIEGAVPGGLGVAQASDGDHTVYALAVVNAVGAIVDAEGHPIAGEDVRGPRPAPAPTAADEAGLGNTVLAVVAVEARLDKREVHWLACRGSDGITTSVRPAHTRYDGDVTFAVAAPRAGAPPPDLDVLGYLATEAVASAIRSAPRS